MAARKAAKKARKVAKKKVAKKKSAARSKTKAPWAAAQLRDYKALQKRAVTLAKSLTDADFDAKGDPVNPAWSRLLSDLDAFAAKYSVKPSTREHDHAGTGGGTDPVPRSAGGGCPGSFETKPRYHTTLPNGDVLMEQTSCTLKRKTLLGRCVYSCISGVFTA
jgi:hypothetical protein